MLGTFTPNTHPPLQTAIASSSVLRHSNIHYSKLAERKECLLANRKGEKVNRFKGKYLGKSKSMKCGGCVYTSTFLKFSLCKKKIILVGFKINKKNTGRKGMRRF